MKEIKRYTTKEKLLLIKEYLSSGESLNSFQDKRGLGHCTISRWMNNVRPKDTGQHQDKMKKKIEVSEKKSQRELALETKIIQLEKELKAEKLRSLAYDTLIDIAEEEFAIDIRKNFGAKQ